MLRTVNKYRRPVVILMCFVMCYFVLSHFEHRPLYGRISCLKSCRLVSLHKKKTDIDLEIPNPFNFSYPINNEDACRRQNVEVIMPVTTALYNFNTREVMRNSSQAHFAKDPRNGLKMLFFVGLPSEKLINSSSFQKRLENEAARYNDIIQIQLKETYLNLVYKSLAIMYWISTYCNSSTFVLRTDDDVDINAPSAILALYRKRKRFPNFVMGEQRDKAKPVRKKSAKYYMSRQDFPGDVYPSYIAGPAMGYPTSTSLLLYRKALQTKIIWIEDVLFGGIIREALGIPGINDYNFKTKSIHNQKMPKYFVYS